MTSLRQTSFRAALVLAAAAALAGCGRRGPLEAPSGSAAANGPVAAIPGGLPRNTETAPIDAAATPDAADIGGAAAPAPAPPTRGPARPFPLDPLL